MKTAKALLNIRWYIAGVILAWTVLVGIPFSLNIYQERQLVLEFAKVQARSSLNMDLVYRHWNASFGGVYVPVTETTPPNPYLKVPNRDVTTTTGIELTLINPAYMMRQVHELGGEFYDDRRHITSLNPIRPKNAPDAWEAEALKAFETGVTEVSSVEANQGAQYLRLMIPLITEEACLKCHAIQGYEVGNIQGGLSVSVSLTPYLTGYQSNAWKIALGYGLLWVLGTAGIFTAGRRIDWQMQERKRAEAGLHETESIFASFLEYSPVYVFFKDKEIRFLRLSRNYEQMLGMPISQMLGKTMHELFPSDLAKKMVEDDLRILNQGQRVDVVEELNGRVYETTKFPIYKDGKPHILVGFTLDITEHKRAEDTLRESEASLKFSQQVAHVGHWTWDIVANRVTWSDEMKRIFGLDPVTFDGDLDKIIAQSIHPDDQEKVNASNATVLSEQKPIPMEYRVIWPDRSVHIVWAEAGEKILDGNGKILKLSGIVQDITERKQAEEAIQESEEKFRNLFENMNDGFALHKIILDNNGKPVDYEFIDVNPVFVKRVGMRAEDLINHTALELFPKTEQAWIDTFGQVAIYGEPVQFTNYSVEMNKHYETRLYSPRPGYFAGLFSDITERKQAEETLRESEERYRLLFERTMEGVYRSTHEGRFVDVNPAMVKMFGYSSREELLNVDIKNELYFAPDERGSHILDTGREETDIYRMRRKDGTEIWVEDHGSYVHDEQGRIIYHEGMLRDITERKRAEKELRESEERFATLSESSFEGIVFSDKGIVIDCNEQLAAILGYERSEIIGAMVSKFVAPESLEDVLVHIRSGSEASYEHLSLRKDGSKFPVEIRAKATYYKGQMVRVTTIRDITERKQAEIEREKLITDLSAKNAELERFTYTVSHDLKSPIVTIRGFLGYLKEDALSGNTTRMENDIQRITNATDKMQALLRDLLELSRIGRMMNAPETIQFEDLVQDALDIVHGQFEARRVTVLTQPNLPAVNGDRQRLTEVLQNLLDNAIKYMGNQPDPRIEIGQRGTEDGKPIFFVKDNGIGIASEYHERIFGLFNKLDAKSDDTGIGLALVKRIVEVHGGRIWVESEIEKGSTFYFTLQTS